MKQKHIPIALIAATFLINSAFAVEFCQDGTAQNITFNEISQNTTKSHAQTDMKSKKICDEVCRKMELHADFIYWRADEDGLEYGTKMKAGPIIGVESQTKTRFLDLDFQWDPGVRVGLGYTFDHFDCWKLDLNWTHLHSHAQNRSSARGIESQIGKVDTIVSPWVNLLFELRAGASEASAHWDLHYDTIDLDFGKNLRLSRRFSANPYFGFRGAILDQNYKVRYKNVFILAESAPSFTRSVRFKAKNDFKAFGLRGGTELMCHLSENWHIFSELSASVLYGKFSVRMKNENDQGLGQGDVPPMPIDFTTTDKLRRTRFNFEEAIGLGYDAFFNDCRYRLRLRFAYEASQWPSQNELFYTFYLRGTDTISIVPTRNQGNLGFHGIRIGAQFDF